MPERKREERTGEEGTSSSAEEREERTFISLSPFKPDLITDAVQMF